MSEVADEIKDSIPEGLPAAFVEEAIAVAEQPELEEERFEGD